MNSGNLDKGALSFPAPRNERLQLRQTTQASWRPHAARAYLQSFDGTAKTLQPKSASPYPGTKRLGPYLIVIREERLLAVDLVARDNILALWRDQPVNERLGVGHLNMRKFSGVHQYHAVLIE
jgi:hypothetical protein